MGYRPERKRPKIMNLIPRIGMEHFLSFCPSLPVVRCARVDVFGLMQPGMRTLVTCSWCSNSLCFQDREYLKYGEHVLFCLVRKGCRTIRDYSVL